KAIGDRSPIRVEWGPYDAKGADGTLVEIKTTGYLQSWATKRLSTPRWQFASVNAEKVWSEDAGDYVSLVPYDRALVWVMALQTCREPDVYDPLDVNQWEFRAIPHRRLLQSGQKSAGLVFFDRLAIEPVPYCDLAEAVRRARAANDLLAVR